MAKFKYSSKCAYPRKCSALMRKFVQDASNLTYISSAGLPIAISKIINEYNTLGKMDAKIRAYHIGKKIMGMLAVSIFVLLFWFAHK